MSATHHKILCPDFQGSGVHHMAYRSFGPKSIAGEAVPNIIICIHGLTRNCRDFDFLAEHLVRNMEDARVICVDIAGRGDSDSLQDPNMYGYSLYVADILYLIERLGEGDSPCKFHIIGTSMGGIIGMMIAAQGDVLSSLVMNDIGAMMPSEPVRDIARYVGEVMFDDLAAARREVERRLNGFGLEEEEMTREREHFITHSMEAAGNGKIRLRYDPDIAIAYKNRRGGTRQFPDIKLWHFWDEVRCRTMLIRGQSSTLFPREVFEQMQQNPCVTSAVELPGCGHAPSLSSMRQMSLITEFI